jgi:predicted Fe-Mo cluster-binding NifX family protein
MELFGTGGGVKTALAMNVPFLGQIPFDPGLVECGDAGESYMEKYPDSEATAAYNQIVEKIVEGSQTETTVAESTRKKEGKEKPKKEKGIMKFAIPVAEGKLTAHFGHAAEFAIVHIEKEEVKEKELLTPPPHEPGVLPKWLHELGVDVIIAGGMGQKALSLFGENGIKVVTGAPSLAPEELVQQYLSNSLETGANVCDH